MTPLEKLLGEMHTALAQEMLTRLQSGEATTADLNVIRQFLKDNDITQSAVPDTPVFKLAQGLPFADVPVAQNE